MDFLIIIIVLVAIFAFLPAATSNVRGKDEAGRKCCPYCKSTNFQYAGQQTYGARPQKTKTKYTVNLNPFRPFTLMNKKEKVVKKARSGFAVDEFICLNCGKRFM